MSYSISVILTYTNHKCISKSRIKIPKRSHHFYKLLQNTNMIVYFYNQPHHSRAFNNHYHSLHTKTHTHKSFVVTKNDANISIQIHLPCSTHTILNNVTRKTKIVFIAQREVNLFQRQTKTERIFSAKVRVYIEFQFSWASFYLAFYSFYTKIHIETGNVLLLSLFVW